MPVVDERSPARGLFSFAFCCQQKEEKQSKKRDQI
jgi:hypothetical protein